MFASVCPTQPGRESLFMLRTHNINFDIYFENDLQKCKIAKGLKSNYKVKSDQARNDQLRFQV